MEQIRTTDDQMQANLPGGTIVAPDVLTEILRQGAQRMLSMAIETEVKEYLAEHCRQLDHNGQRLVVRNGYLPQRQIQTGIGQVAIRQPRVNDKRLDQNGQRRAENVIQMLEFSPSPADNPTDLDLAARQRPAPWIVIVQMVTRLARTYTSNRHLIVMLIAHDHPANHILSSYHLTPFDNHVISVPEALR